MNYIWQHNNWPSLFVDKNKIAGALSVLKKEEELTTNVFSMIKGESSYQLRANLIAEEISASLNIENEQIDINSVFSSVAKHLLIKCDLKGYSTAYSDNLVEMISDAYENKSPISIARFLNWQKMLFINQAGLSKKIKLGFRDGPEYVIKNSGKNADVIFEAVPNQDIEHEMNMLIDYINNSSENSFIKAAVSSLWFVIIHPFEDGNGRISRALADYILLKDSSETLPLACLSINILKNRKEYYKLIEDISSQKESLEISEYVCWFLKIISESFVYSRERLARTISISGFIGSLSPDEYNSREIHMLYLLASGLYRGKVTNEKWSKINKCSSTVAFRDIQHLIKQNLLIPSGELGPKAGYYFNEETLNQPLSKLTRY